MTATGGFSAIGTRVGLAVTEPAALGAALELLRDEVAALDVACSRFRDDSDLARVNAAAGRWVAVGPLLVEAVRAAVAVASATDGLVDPALGADMCTAGYDRDLAELRDAVTSPTATSPVRPHGAVVEVEAAGRRIRVAPGAALDLGATAKALGADRAARHIADALGCGVLVDLGGDLSAAGRPPANGWPVQVADGDPCSADGPTVSIVGGGLATSSTVLRRWRHGGVERHHILDPRTGTSAPPIWRTVTVAAGTCVDANAAATASVVLGLAAPEWLAQQRLPARLVAADHSVTVTGGWPEETS